MTYAEPPAPKADRELALLLAINVAFPLLVQFAFSILGNGQTGLLGGILVAILLAGFNLFCFVRTSGSYRIAYAGVGAANVLALILFSNFSVMTLLPTLGLIFG